MFRVMTGKKFGILPYAHALRGSEVRDTFIGFTVAHAARRAKKWLASRAAA
jgi:hypothetical protein